MKTKIQESKSKLNDKVLETGHSPTGERLIEISDQFSNRIDELITRVSNNETINSSDIEKLIGITSFKYDTIKVDTSFINLAFKDYSENSKKEFITSLLLFNLSMIENTRDLFNSYFFDVEYFKPLVISDDFTIKMGETFKGTAISQAKMAAIKYIYEIDDPQTEEGFVELSSWASSGYDGIVEIKGTSVGRHKVKIRTTQIADGKELTFEGEFEITVTK
ncbi:hypothetical protein [uncultured Roseivirga sp.]|uniref:hypothetical protein n=1 Tax=uncultured Roseivirga sp. TaxID=543088 RepID=UPI0030DC4F83